jgi:hypothetical protein
VLVLISLALLSPFIVIAPLVKVEVEVEEEGEGHMMKVLPSPAAVEPKVAAKTADTPADSLPFPGKLVDGKYDVQYLHL